VTWRHRGEIGLRFRVCLQRGRQVRRRRQRSLLSYPTVLDGSGTGYFVLEPDGPLTLDGVTFSNFSGTNATYNEGGVNFATTSSSITLTRFIANHNSTFVLGNHGESRARHLL
jgi:hypothetical protein